MKGNQRKIALNAEEIFKREITWEKRDYLA